MLCHVNVIDDNILHWKFNMDKYLIYPLVTNDVMC